MTTTFTVTETALNKLDVAEANVRRTGRGNGIEELAASIAAHGLLQSLVVRLTIDDSGAPTGRYEVVAGGRRLTALKLLVKRKAFGKAGPVPCRVLDGEDAGEASLAENVVRLDMHPADQFEAFARLHQDGQGLGIEDIAARFGVSAHTVRQRLRLRLRGTPTCLSPPPSLLAGSPLRNHGECGIGDSRTNPTRQFDPHLRNHGNPLPRKYGGPFQSIDGYPFSRIHGPTVMRIVVSAVLRIRGQPYYRSYVRRSLRTSVLTAIDWAKDFFMHVLVLASQKGGAGKTTLSRHLAVEAERVGEGPVVLIDADPQGGLAGWWNRRQAVSPVFFTSQLEDLPRHIEQARTGGFSLVIIDTPPQATGLIRAVVKLADLVLIPTRPSPDDLDAVGRTIDIVDEAGKPMVFVINGATKNARITGQAAIALSQSGTVATATIHHSVAFPTSGIDGRTVSELDSASNSSKEVAELWRYVATRLRKSARAAA